jgi:hypothetical protein
MVQLPGDGRGLLIQLFIEPSQHLRKSTQLTRVDNRLSHNEKSLCGIVEETIFKLTHSRIDVPSADWNFLPEPAPPAGR